MEVLPDVCTASISIYNFSNNEIDLQHYLDNNKVWTNEWRIKFIKQVLHNTSSEQNFNHFPCYSMTSLLSYPTRHDCRRSRHIWGSYCFCQKILLWQGNSWLTELENSCQDRSPLEVPICEKCRLTIMHLTCFSCVSCITLQCNLHEHCVSKHQKYIQITGYILSWGATRFGVLCTSVSSSVHRMKNCGFLRRLIHSITPVYWFSWYGSTRNLSVCVYHWY